MNKIDELITTYFRLLQKHNKMLLIFNIMIVFTIKSLTNVLDVRHDMYFCCCYILIGLISYKYIRYILCLLLLFFFVYYESDLLFVSLLVLNIDNINILVYIAIFVSNFFISDIRLSAIYYVLVIRKITGIIKCYNIQKYKTKLEESLQDNNDLLNSKKTIEQFIRYIFHEIRIPFNTIQLAVDILRDKLHHRNSKPSSPKSPSIIARKSRSGSRININERNKQVLMDESFDDIFNFIVESINLVKNMLNNVLTYYSLTNGLIELEKSIFNIKQVSKELIDLFMLQANSKNIFLKHYINVNKNENVVGDVDKFKDILSNFVSNAIKYSPIDSVVEIHINNMTTNLYQIKVINDGDLEKEICDKLFKPFCTLKKNKSDGTSGLGLSIVRQIVLLMRGSCGCSSENKKVVFWADIFLDHYEEQHKIDISVENTISPNIGSIFVQHILPPTRKKILIVEDSDINRKLMSRILVDSYELTEAVNGNDAIKKFIRPDNTDGINVSLFDCILMDKEMPILDGYGATSKLRELGVKCPIIGITGNGLQCDIDDFMNTGLTDILIKPINKQQLLDIVAKYV